MSSKKSEARERVKAMREQQARQERKRERLLRFGIAGAVLAAVVIIAVAVASTRGGDDDSTAQAPASATEDAGIPVGEASAPVTIDLWIDFLCPHCKQFEDANAATINQLVASGDARVVYHPVTYTGNVYSARANNAFACAADEDKAAEFVEAAFVEQEQWGDNALVGLGEGAGIGGDYETCVREETYEDWATLGDSVGRDAGISGTPTVFINGTELPNDQWTAEGIQAAVTAAAAGGGTSPSATAVP